MAAEMAAKLVGSIRAKFESTGNFFDKQISDQTNIVVDLISKKISTEDMEKLIVEGRRIEYEEAISIALEL